jgi:hypothetical protein
MLKYRIIKDLFMKFVPQSKAFFCEKENLSFFTRCKIILFPFEKATSSGNCIAA